MRSEHRNFRDDGLGQSCANSQCLRTKKAASTRTKQPRSIQPRTQARLQSLDDCANIDTPDTNWQPEVWEENFQDQRSLALVRLLPGEATRAATKRQLLHRRDGCSGAGSCDAGGR